jgi:hypothetical protein
MLSFAQHSPAWAESTIKYFYNERKRRPEVQVAAFFRSACASHLQAATWKHKEMPSQRATLGGHLRPLRGCGLVQIREQIVLQDLG